MLITDDDMIRIIVAMMFCMMQEISCIYFYNVRKNAAKFSLQISRYQYDEIAKLWSISIF